LGETRLVKRLPFVDALVRESQEIDMPTTIINLKVKTIEENAVTLQNNQLGT
jgi:hypothetical protein